MSTFLVTTRHHLGKKWTLVNSLYLLCVVLIVGTAAIVMSRPGGGIDLRVSQLREMQAYQQEERLQDHPESDALDLEIATQEVDVIHAGGSLSRQDLDGGIRGLEHLRLDTKDPDTLRIVDSEIQELRAAEPLPQ